MGHQLSLRDEVALRSLQGYRVALLYVNVEVARLERDPEPDIGALMEARIVRAEVLQKMGHLRECEAELDKVVVTRLTPVSCQGYLLIKAKIHMQRGDVQRSRVSLQALRDRTGPDNYGEISKTYLWRQAFVLGTLDDKKASRRVSDEHRSFTVPGGFQEANNTIYAGILPALAVGDSVIYGWRRSVDKIRGASQLYIDSDVDFSGRLGNRAKSLCHALLVEAFLLWIVENRLDSYRIGFTAAILLKHWHLKLFAEGVGEVVGALGARAEGLVSAIGVYFQSSDDEPISYALAALPDRVIAEIAFEEAAKIATEVLATGDIANIYDYIGKSR